MSRRTFHYLILVALLAVAGFVRLWNLETNPLWYTDETNYIILARNIGQTISLANAPHKALLFPFATDAVPHPPLYFVLNGLLMRAMGDGVLTGRMLSAVAGLLSMGLLFRGTLRLFGLKAAAIAALLFAFHYPSVFFLRWGMPYNLAMFFVIGSFWAMAESQRRKNSTRWQTLALLLCGLGSLSAFFALPILCFLTLLMAWRGRRRPLSLIGSLMAGWLPFAVFVAYGVLQRGGNFWGDFMALGARASGSAGFLGGLDELGMQLARLLTGSRLRQIGPTGEFEFWSVDPAYPVGIVGLIWIFWRARSRRWIVLFFFFAALPVMLKRAGDPEIKYDEVMFLFLIHLGAGVAVSASSRTLHRLSRKRKLLAQTPMGAAVVMIAVLAGLRLWQIATHLPSRFETYGSVRNNEDAIELARQVNARVSEDDLVIAPERIDFLLKGKVANVYQAVAFVHGYTTWHLNIEPSRWAFQPDYRKARMIILDATDVALVLQPNNPNMPQLAEELNSARWRLHETGEYLIFEPTPQNVY